MRLTPEIATAEAVRALKAAKFRWADEASSRTVDHLGSSMIRTSVPVVGADDMDIAARALASLPGCQDFTIHRGRAIVWRTTGGAS